jgi:hypothetical protein
MKKNASFLVGLISGFISLLIVTLIVIVVFGKLSIH